MNQLFDVDEPCWLDPNILDYGNSNPAQWHAALVAILKLRPPRRRDNATTIHYEQWTEALQTIHDIIAREMAITR